MNTQITMPSLGADMTEGKLLNWRIKIGDHIKKGQVVADIETQKAAVEMESFSEGLVVSLKALPQDIVPVGAVMAELSSELSEPLQQSPIDRRATPAAKKLAADNKIDWQQLRGSGPVGAVELKDVQAVLGKTESHRDEGKGSQQNSSFIDMRAAISKAMEKSKHEIPHYYLKTSVDVDPLLEKLEDLNKTNLATDRILLASVIAKITASTLADFPELNGFYREGRFQPAKEINVGIAVSLKKAGLITPCLFSLPEKSIFEFSKDFNDLIYRARSSQLRSKELSEGTFTISNLGDQGAQEVFGIIFPPQVALLGVGAVHQKPVIKAGQIVIGHELNLTLSGDHRVSDGISGSRFLQTLKFKMESGTWA